MRFMDGFADELMKLAVGDVYPETEDPNFPWRADTEARGIKDSARRPSRVATGHLGQTGPAGKTTGADDRNDGGQDQSGAEQAE